MRTYVRVVAGPAHARFTPAIQRGNLFAAEMAARELRRLGLGDALALTVLLSKGQAPRYERAAVRWHGRLELETQLLTQRRLIRQSSASSVEVGVEQRRCFGDRAAR